MNTIAQARQGPRVSVNLVAGMVLVATLATAGWTAWRMDIARKDAPPEDLLYVQSPQTARIMSLGYTGLAACIYWTRAVQYFGEKNLEKSRDFSLLPKLLDLTVSLDPHLDAAYQFGSVFLAQAPPYGAGLPDEAAKFVERGIQNNPNEWRLYYDLGFIHYMERHDYKAAADAFERGSKVAGNPPWMKALPALMLQHAGDIATARVLWTELYQESDNESMRENALIRLICLRVDDDVIHLERITRAYMERTGSYPTNWQELIASRLLGGVPLDPSRMPYQLEPNGRVVVQDPRPFPFIEHGVPKGKNAYQSITPEAEKLLKKTKPPVR